MDPNAIGIFNTFGTFDVYQAVIKSVMIFGEYSTLTTHSSLLADLCDVESTLYMYDIEVKIGHFMTVGTSSVLFNTVTEDSTVYLGDIDVLIGYVDKNTGAVSPIVLS